MLRRFNEASWHGLSDLRVTGEGIAQAEAPKSLEEMTKDYIDHIRSLQPQGPYRSLGWSLGGNVAQSIAVQRRRRVKTLNC